MKLKTFENRTKNIARNCRGYQLAKELLTSKERVYTGMLVRTGRFTSAHDYTSAVILTLTAAKLKQDIDFKHGNSASIGGRLGNYIELTSKGKSKAF